MKKLLSLAIGILFISFVFTSCTENIVTDDEQVIMESQAIDKDEVIPPGGSEETDPDDTED